MILDDTYPSIQTTSQHSCHQMTMMSSYEYESLSTPRSETDSSETTRLHHNNYYYTFFALIILAVALHFKGEDFLAIVSHTITGESVVDQSSTLDIVTIEDANKLLQAARKPVAVIGTTAMRLNNPELLRDFVNRNAMPFASTTTA